MIIVLKQNAPDAQVHEFCHELEGMGLQINDSKGSDTHILGLIGDTKAIAESWVLANPVVETCRRVSEPYKKANRKFHPDDSVIDVEGVKIGGGNFAVIAGPCSIESEEQITYCAQRVKAAGASLLRGGAFKPRTSPYSFQGMRSEGLDLLKLARRATGSPIVTEIMNTELVPLFADVTKLNAWSSAASTQAAYPKPQGYGLHYQYSGLFDCDIEKVHFLRLKQLTLGYNLEEKIVRKIGISSARFFVTAENLFLLTNYSGIDPELIDPTNGMDNLASYPLPRKFTVGLTVNF